MPTITAANTFKYDSLHTLVMFRHHDPLVWTKPQFLDLMHTATKWFDAAYKSNPQVGEGFLLLGQKKKKKMALKLSPVCISSLDVGPISSRQCFAASPSYAVQPWPVPVVYSEKFPVLFIDALAVTMGWAKIFASQLKSTCTLTMPTIFAI